MQKEDCVDICLVNSDATHFDKSLQELRDFSSQLYQTAEYCEATFLAAEDKRIILENTKQYISRAVVSAVEHLGSISTNLETSMFQTTSIPHTNRKIDLLKTRIVTCQQRSHKLSLEKFYLTADISKHHCRYILPPSTNPPAICVVSRNNSKDDIEAKTKKADEFVTDEPLFMHTYNCKPSLVHNSTKNNVFPPPVVPVRGDGLSIIPKSEQSVFHFKKSLKLKRGTINWKMLNNKATASIVRRASELLHKDVKDVVA